MSKNKNRETNIQSSQTTPLEDLELTPEQGDETKAGTGGGGGAGKCQVQDLHFVVKVAK